MISKKNIQRVIFIICLHSFSCVFAGTEKNNHLSELSVAFNEVSEHVSNSVVNIKIKQTPEVSNYYRNSPFSGDLTPFHDDFFKFFFAPPSGGSSQNEVILGQGTGFVIKKSGYIVTNNHVVKDANAISVKFQDGREADAKLVGQDPKTDIAVLKIDGDNFQVLPMADSDQVKVGEWVLAIGNPFGLSNTMTAGIISAKGRSNIGITDYENFIQTDAAINPGNSGGPLVNLKGEAIGLNTAIFSKSGGYMGIGFSIPANIVKHISNQIIDKGEVTRSYLGVQIQDLTKELAKNFGLSNTHGVLVSKVESKSPAEIAGIKQGDIVLKYDGKNLRTSAEFKSLVALSTPGTTHNIVIYRSGKEQVLSIQPTELGQNSITQLDSYPIGKTGVIVQNINKELSERLGIAEHEGVVISDIAQNSPAENIGLKKGMLILELNKSSIRNIDDIKKIVDNRTRTILALVGSRYQYFYVSLTTG